MGQSVYTAVDLGDLGGGSSFGMGINNAGTVVGYSTVVGAPLVSGNYSFPGSNLPQGFTTPVHAFSYSNGTLTDLGVLGTAVASSAAAINNAGIITGWLLNADGTFRPFTYSNGAMTDLGLINNQRYQFDSINLSGGAAGSIQGFHGFVSVGGVGTTLGTLGGSRSYATGINDSNTVVGWSDSTPATNSQAHAFSFINGIMVDLGTLNGSTFSQAEGINNGGVAVGYAINGSNGYNHAVTFSNGSVTDLGTIGGLYPFSIGNAINNAGVAVGSSSKAGEGGDRYPVGGAGQLAVVYFNGFVADLNGLSNLPGITLATAVAINDSGQIVADDSNGRAYLLSPVPGEIAGISAQPMPQASYVGSSATFSVTGTGAGLSYRWYLNGVPLADGAQQDGSVVSGSASASLSILNLQLDDSNASVAVVVANPLGKVTSSAVTLTLGSSQQVIFSGDYTLPPNVIVGNSGTGSLAVS
ncbi:MAG TPA: hypothetical protein VN877_06490, partial [Opitutaceae bacterium]|nr:hypothetical protein [Opitutaceae bacterium]